MTRIMHICNRCGRQLPVGSTAAVNQHTAKTTTRSDATKELPSLERRNGAPSGR